MGDDYSFVILLVKTHGMEQRLKLNLHWCMINTCSSINLIYNPMYASNICDAKKHININCNAGTAVCQKVCHLGSLIFWYQPDGIASLLSMNTILKSSFRLQYTKIGQLTITYPNNVVTVNMTKRVFTTSIYTTLKPLFYSASPPSHQPGTKLHVLKPSARILKDFLGTK